MCCFHLQSWNWSNLTPPCSSRVYTSSRAVGGSIKRVIRFGQCCTYQFHFRMCICDDWMCCFYLQSWNWSNLTPPCSSRVYTSSRAVGGSIKRVIRFVQCCTYQFHFRMCICDDWMCCFFLQWWNWSNLTPSCSSRVYTSSIAVGGFIKHIISLGECCNYQFHFRLFTAMIGCAAFTCSPGTGQISHHRAPRASTRAAEQSVVP
jgi:uncharacterized membrane protein